MLSCMLSACPPEQTSQSALEALRMAVETAVSASLGVSTPNVDVFIRETLFPEAISVSARKLAIAAREEEGMVAWGNTNTQV